MPILNVMQNSNYSVRKTFTILATADEFVRCKKAGIVEVFGACLA
jgi:hypothetical protein